mgnify:CR=1 FL=1
MMAKFTKTRISFKKWLFQDMPKAATSEGWNEWEAKSKKQKFRWFLASTVPDWYRSVFSYPVSRFNDKIRARFVTKTWRIDVSTLSKTEYHISSTIIEHGLFHILTDFILDEKAWLQYISTVDEPETWYWTLFGRYIRKWRWNKFTIADKREMAMLHLEWEIGLADPSSPNYHNRNSEGDYDIYGPKYKSTQSFSAAEQKALFIWWNDIRPARVDPYDIEGVGGYSWTRYCNEYGSTWGNKTPEETIISDSALEAANKAEAEYENEDTAMLLRLIKIRGSLWT